MTYLLKSIEIVSEIDESKKDNEIEINSYLEFVELSVYDWNIIIYFQRNLVQNNLYML